MRHVQHKLGGKPTLQLAEARLYFANCISAMETLLVLVEFDSVAAAFLETDVPLSIKTLLN